MSSSAETMSSLVNEFSEAETGVFWDLDDCPIPEDLTPASINANIKLALTNAGYSGRVSIVAYSTEDQTKEEFDLADIKLIKPDSSLAKVNMIFKDVYMWGITHRSDPTNLMVISKDISEDTDFVSALLNLSKKENNILLAHPQPPSGRVKRIASWSWLWTSLSVGGSPIDNPSETPSPACPCCKRLCTFCKKKESDKKKRRL